MNKIVGSLNAAALLFVSTRLCAAGFDTISLWNGTAFIGSFGVPDTQTYGQTFVAPDASSLVSFRLLIQSGTGNVFQYKAFVMDWAGPMTGSGGGAGAIRWLGPSTSLTTDGTFQAIDVTTGGVSLTTGGLYVLGISVADDVAANSWLAVFARNDSHAADLVGGGGGFVFHNAQGSPSLPSATSWNTFADFGDLAFQAEFVPDPVPEASTWAAGVGVVLSIVLTANRRLRANPKSNPS